MNPRPKLDATDRAIIEHLQADGRLPYTRLGTLVGLSEAAVRQRVQRLTEAGVMQVVAVTNPLAGGKRRMAMIAVRTHGPIEPISAALAAIGDLAYLVVTAGSHDFLCEAVVDSDAALLTVCNQIRAIPGVDATETFIYLDLVKQTYEWGAT